jgi:hypothetical protein
MRIAIVVADDRPSAAQRAAHEHSRLLRAAGHAVELVVAREERGASFVGQTRWPDGMIGVAQARRADYDVTLATSWRAFFAMFALRPAAAPA